jgi:AraC-like DNA-binding protein
MASRSRDWLYCIFIPGRNTVLLDFYDTSAMGIQIVEYKPGKSLRPFVEVYWEGIFEVDESNHLSMQVIPNGCVEMIIHISSRHCNLLNVDEWSNTPPSIIIGLFTKAYEVRFKNSVRVFAIRFKPEGIYNIFGVPASAFNGRYEDMSMVLGKEFRDFSNRLKEEYSVTNMISRTEDHLMKNLIRNKIGFSYVNRAAELIRQTKGIRIDELPDQVFISQRQLEREFKEKIGITPKQYLRITRLNEVQRLIADNHTINLSHVAYHCGYSDQAHFIRDFKNITGEIPTIFLRANERFMTNAGLSHYEY